jgi:hypothetical protein
MFSSHERSTAITERIRICLTFSVEFDAGIDAALLDVTSSRLPAALSR